MIEHILIRYGEISLKGKNRSSFERILQENVRAVLKQWPQVSVRRESGRMMVSLNGVSWREVAVKLQRVFGIFSISPVHVTSTRMEDIVAAGCTLFDEEGSEQKVRTFKVEARRADKTFPMKSPDIARHVGGEVLTEIPHLRVDVHNPDLTIYVEILEGEAMVYGAKLSGLGGMPVRTAGKVGLLLSGGIDSPVAGWLALKRGVQLNAVHFHSFPFTSERALQKVETLTQTLAEWGGSVRLHTVHFTDVQTAIKKHCKEELGITIMRRMMLRIATKLAEQQGWLALVTGESLGQVASQTLESMKAINAVTNIPILRPLISEDKVDIMRRARQIGTYETSILPYEDCCTIFVPKSPRTRPTIEEVELEEANLDVDTLVAEAVARTTITHFQAGTEV